MVAVAGAEHVVAAEEEEAEGAGDANTNAHTFSLYSFVSLYYHVL